MFFKVLRPGGGRIVWTIFWLIAKHVKHKLPWACSLELRGSEGDTAVWWHSWDPLP